MKSVEWPDTSQLFDEAEYVMKNPVHWGEFFFSHFCLPLDNATARCSQHASQKTMYNGQEKKPFKTSVIHCCQTNTHFFIWTVKKGGRLGEARNKTWITWWSWKLIPSKMYTVPRFYSVWEKFISCLFRSLRSKKNISSEAFSPALHCTALYNSMLTAAVSRKFWYIVRICITRFCTFLCWSHCTTTT